MVKSDIRKAWNNLKTNFAVSLRKDGDYIVLGYYDGAGRKLHDLMITGWREVA